MPGTDDLILDQLRDNNKLLLELVECVKLGLGALHKAEQEVPEHMRRFTMYFHDLHDVLNFYHELGQVPPTYISREVERCHDRMAHLIEDETNQGGTFHAVAQKVRERGGGRYIKGAEDEARPSESRRPRRG